MENTPSHLVAVDGGGSTCRVAICGADRRVLATATGAAANPATSLPGAIASLRATLAEAQGRAGLSDGDIAGARAWLGLAGVIDDTIADRIAAAMPMREATVTDDRPTSMAGALGGGDGFLAALGTGSFLGRQRGGEQRFVGGWGFWLGDQASGAWVGRAALAAVLEWRDGLRPASPLLETLYRGFDGGAGALVHFAKSATPPEFAAHAPVVFDAADAGDGAALAILGGGAEYLARALDTLGYTPGDPLCLTGGVGPRFARHLPPRYTGNLVQPQGTALDGAILLAARTGAEAAP